MAAFISTPKNIPFWLRIGIWFSERVTGHEMLPARLLAWYPKAAIGSGLLEALVAHKDGNLDERILKLVRIQASYSASCAFCIDMNSAMTEETGILPEELLALQGRTEITLVTSLTPREQIGHRILEAYISDPIKVSPRFHYRIETSVH